MRRSPPPVASLGAALVLLLLGCPLAAAQCTEAGQTVVFGTGNVALATGYNTSDGWAARALSWSCGCHIRKTLTCTLKNAAKMLFLCMHDAGCSTPMPTMTSL